VPDFNWESILPAPLFPSRIRNIAGYNAAASTRLCEALHHSNKDTTDATNPVCSGDEFRWIHSWSERRGRLD
jgi:hypothetical protein